MVTVKIGNEPTIHSFQVINDLGMDVIIGNDLLKKLGLTIDFANEVIRNRDGNPIPMAIRRPPSVTTETHDPAYLLKGKIIPPRSSILVQVRVPCKESNTLREIYTPLQTFAVTRVYVPSGIIGESGRAIVELVNVCRFPIHLRKGITIAWVTKPERDPVNIIDYSKTLTEEQRAQTTEEREKSDKETIDKLIDELDLSIDSALDKSNKWNFADS